MQESPENRSEPVHKYRLHPIAAALQGLRVLRQLVPLLILALVTQNQESNLGFAAYMIIMGGTTTVLGVARWWAFRYWVQDDELCVEQGILLRRRVFIPRDRIQAFNVSAGVLQRLFGLVRVQVKSAAAGSQAELSAVSRTEAQRLRAQLIPDGLPAATSATSATTSPEPVVETRWRMTPQRLLFAASTSGQIGVILGGIGWVYTQVDQFVQERIIEWLETAPWIESVQGTDVSVVAVLLVAGLALAWVLSVGGALLRYGGFAVTRRGRDLVVVRGLLERRETSIPVDRVQAIRISEGLLRQPFGFATIYVESAGHAEERGRSTYLHPCIHRSEWKRFLEEMVPEFAVEADLIRPPGRALRRFLFVPLLLTGSIALAATLLIPYGALAWALPAAVALFQMLSWRDTGVGYSSDRNAVVLRSRFAQRVTAIVVRRRMQFASVAASFFQRRWRLATCYVGAASGASGRVFSARDLDEKDALSIFDWASPSDSATLTATQPSASTLGDEFPPDE